MAKKRQVKIPASCTVRCPHCSKNSRVSLQEDTFLGRLECKKCHKLIQTPPAYCCVVCAFSKKKCPQSLVQEAKMKGLEIKREKQKEEKSEKIKIEPGTPILLIDEKIERNQKTKLFN